METTELSLLRVSTGPHTTAIEIDPYWDSIDWHEAARGDGRSYSMVEWVHREEGESFEAFFARAQARADELNAQE